MLFDELILWMKRSHKIQTFETTPERRGRMRKSQNAHCDCIAMYIKSLLYCKLPIELYLLYEFEIDVCISYVK